MAKLRSVFREHSWIGIAIGSVALWLIMGIAANKLTIGSFLSNAYIAAYLAIMAFGQMLVVTSGRGAIDLSIPGVITLSAFVTMATVNGSNLRILPAILLVIALGWLIGVLNSLMVIYLKIPAMIATMAMNYILTTAALLFNKRFSIFTSAPALDAFSKFRLFGVQIMIYIVIGVTILMYIMVYKTPFGKSLSAMGQNKEAARYAGIDVVRTERLTYVMSAVLAGLGGFLLAARAGNAILGMGDSYSLETIASVVVGGTLMSGGRANVVGTLFGCLFLNMISTAMQIMGFGSGAQNIAKGALIILVFVFSGSQKKN